MTFYVNSASPANAGLAIGKDPNYADGADDTVILIQGEHKVLSGKFAADFIAAKIRPRHVKLTGITNAQRVALRAYLVAGYASTFWRFPHESSDFIAAVSGSIKEKPFVAKGDTVTAPHWDVEFDLSEV